MDGVIETTARLLALLSALQSSSRRWPGPELAERFGVTVRTVRRDVDRLRQLGYPIEAEEGASGGYRIGRGGAAMPPLMLERDEAVAIAAALRATAPRDTTDDAAPSPGSSALAKLEQFLPPTARREVSAVGAMTSRLSSSRSELADPKVLVVVTTACRDHERVRMTYVDRSGGETERTVTPWRVVNAVGRWYVVAFDLGRGEWRTFRLDRINDVQPTGHRQAPPDPPDPHRFVQAALSTGPYRYQARIVMHAPLARLAAEIPAQSAILEEIDAGSTLVTTGGDHLDVIAFHLARLDVEFTVEDPPELAERLGVLAARFTRALSA